MDEPRALEPGAEDASRMQAAIAECLAAIEGLREQMQRDQADIERARERTRAILAQLKAQ